MIHSLFRALFLAVSFISIVFFATGFPTTTAAVATTTESAQGPTIKWPTVTQCATAAATITSGSVTVLVWTKNTSPTLRQNEILPILKTTICRYSALTLFWREWQKLFPFTGIDVASACATRKVLLEQLGRVLPSDVDTLPDKVFLANTADHYGARMAEKLSDNGGFKVLQLFNFKFRLKTESFLLIFLLRNDFLVIDRTR